MSASPNYVIFGPGGNGAAAPFAAPKLLVEWEPGWQGFRSSIGPALARMPRVTGDIGPLFFTWEPRWPSFKTAVRPAIARSERPLEGECQAGPQHGGATVFSVVLHITAILVLLAVPAHIIHTQQVLAAEQQKQYQVIYYSGTELPQMNDVGGAEAGISGMSGGRELYHPTQVIRISRGNKLVDTIVDAPELKLPPSKEAVANLLTMPARNAGPAPASALNRMSLAAGVLPQDAPVPPAPDATRKQLKSLPELAAGIVSAPPTAERQVAGLRLPEIGTANVVPPPISAPPRDSVGEPKLALPALAAVAPPPQVSRAVSSVGVVGFGATQDVVPPAPQAGGQALTGRGIPGGLGGGEGTVVPPPPQVGANGTAEGGVIGGALKALGSLLGAVSGGGEGGASAAIVVSANPGTGVGMPGNGGPGSLAMSPSGGNQPGLGGSGGGSGTGHGIGSGSGASGSGPGSGASGSGFGNAAGAHSGTSPYPGPGGSGSGSSPSGIPGVTIQGGKVAIPGFSSPTEGADPNLVHGRKEPRNRPAITIIASARSGGALNMYGAFKGAKVYTIYLDTRAGVAVLQYAERAVSAHKFEEDLTAPEALRFELPAEVPHIRLLVSCILDKGGLLKNIRLLETPKDAAAASKIVSALQNWKFRPVLRGEEATEVDAVLGMNIDTR